VVVTLWSDVGEMNYRRFTDSAGHTWEAWEVDPWAVERRLAADRRSEPRDSLDRRRSDQFRLMIPSELRDGWLAFQGLTSKVRVAPIPEGWMLLSDEQLSSLVAGSTDED
jgi:hypothetical protein